jgi:hypothetical protein
MARPRRYERRLREATGFRSCGSQQFSMKERRVSGGKTTPLRTASTGEATVFVVSVKEGRGLGGETTTGGDGFSYCGCEPQVSMKERRGLGGETTPLRAASRGEGNRNSWVQLAISV